MPRLEAGSIRDLRRAQILDVARAIVVEDGLDAVTFGALEKRLSFTRGVITHHFRDKDEIVEALLLDAVHEIDAATFAEVERHARFVDKVRAVVATKVHGFLSHPEAAAVLVSFWGRPADRRAAAINAALFGRWREQAAALFAAGQAKGVGPEGPVDVLAAGLVGAVVGIVTQARFEPGAIDVEAAIDITAQRFAYF